MEKLDSLKQIVKTDIKTKITKVLEVCPIENISIIKEIRKQIREIMLDLLADISEFFVSIKQVLDSKETERIQTYLK